MGKVHCAYGLVAHLNRNRGAERAHPWPLGGDGGGGFWQAATGDGWGKGVVAGRRRGGPI
jgi:hypothetical protein